MNFCSGISTLKSSILKYFSKFDIVKEYRSTKTPYSYTSCKAQSDLLNAFSQHAYTNVI